MTRPHLLDQRYRIERFLSKRAERDSLTYCGALALTGLPKSRLFGVRPFETLTFAAVPALLFVVALAAAWVPARRASCVGPMDALRQA